MSPRLAILLSLVLLAGCPPRQTNTPLGSSGNPRGSSSSSGDGQAQGNQRNGNQNTDEQADEGPSPAELAREARSAAESALILAQETPGPAGEVHWRRVESEYATWLAQNPDDPVGLYHRGLALLRLRRFREAEQLLSEATEADPSQPSAWVALGQAHEAQEELSQARRAYQRGLELEPENLDLKGALVGLLRREGRYEQAIEEAKALLHINANTIEAYNILGLTYLDMGEFLLARFVYEKALRAVPGADEVPAIHANLGLVWMNLDAPYDAKAEFERALELDPFNTAALVNLAYLELQNLDFENALNHLTQAQNNDPDSIEITLNIGVARRGIEDLAGARAAYEQVLEREPGHLGALFNLAVLFDDYLGDIDAAIEHYNAYLEAAGDGLAADDPVPGYLEDAETRKAREERRRERERQREERRRQREAEQNQESGAGSSEDPSGSGNNLQPARSTSVLGR